MRILLFILALVSSDVMANTVWPFVAVNMYQRAFTPWVIGLGLGIEFLVVRKVFALKPMRAFVADVTMNLASAFIGLIVFAVSFGALDWIAPGLAESMIDLFHGSYASAGIFAVNFALLCLINTAIEAGVLRWGFKLPVSGRAFVFLLLVNCLSVGASCVVLWMDSIECPSNTRPWFNPGRCI